MLRFFALYCCLFLVVAADVTTDKEAPTPGVQVLPYVLQTPPTDTPSETVSRYTLLAASSMTEDSSTQQAKDASRMDSTSTIASKSPTWDRYTVPKPFHVVDAYDEAFWPELLFSNDHKHGHGHGSALNAHYASALVAVMVLLNVGVFLLGLLGASVSVGRLVSSGGMWASSSNHQQQYRQPYAGYGYRNDGEHL